MIKIELPEKYITVYKDKIKSYKPKLKNKNGVYLIYDENKELLYVGKTKDFYERLYSHVRGKYGSDKFEDYIEFIDVYIVNCPYEREIYETYTINEFLPAFNTFKNYKNQDEIYYEIDERISELTEEKEMLEQELLWLNDLNEEGRVYGDEESELNKLELGEYLLKRRKIEEIENEIKSLQQNKFKCVTKSNKIVS